ncbi:MAG TPA: DUF3821 domain-containing protein [Methanolinea sp.]|nr:DUF3821 domain-containing protein [Methanolinea sp.]HQK55710.1 DUF3821 domain-containing protein [Methanolinea sp.]
MKLRHIVLFLLVTGIALLTVAMPVSAQLNVVAQNGTVLLGEEGLDVTAAVGTATHLGWWSGTDYSTPATREIDLSGYVLTNFNIDDDPLLSPFVGTEGKGAWWRLSGSGMTNPTERAFSVVAPQSNLRIRNLDYGTDVTNGAAIIGDVLDFELNPSTLHYIFLRDPSATFNCKIVVRNPSGVTYSKLWVPSPPASSLKDLTYLDVSSSPWYWSSGNGTAPDPNNGWETDAIDPVTSFPVYDPGEYQVTIECNENKLGFVGTTKTISLEEEQPTITASPSSLIRGNKFYTTITGIPDTYYLVWIKDCVACPNGCCNDPMSGACCDQPPMIVDGQEGVTFADEWGCIHAQCPPQGGSVCDLYESCWDCGCGDGYPPGEGDSECYTLGDTLIEWCGCLCAERLYEIVPHDPSGGKYYYALVKMDENGERTVEWQTTTCTAPTTYKIHTNRWDPNDVCELDLDRPYAETCVDVQKGVVTINTEVCDELTDTTYLGETVRIFGTNTDSKVTYLFFTGPCQSCAGDNMTATNKVVNGNASTFTKVNVKSDGTWEYFWYTRNLQIDLGQFTIYAASMPDDAPTLEGVPCNDCDDVGVSCAAWAKKPFTFLEPTITADVNPKILQIICCAPVPIKVTGQATGLRGETIGKDYGTIPIGIWVFGENKVAGQKYIFKTALIDCPTGDFSIDLSNYMDTLGLLPGTYTVIVQHPMYNHRLDIIPETWICDQSDWCPWLKFDPKVMMDEVWYPDLNRKFVVTATPIRWSKLFVIDGPDRLAGTAALNALKNGFADPNIDDRIVELKFKVESNNALQAGFSGIPTTGGAPLSVQFTDISIGYPTTWLWDFGDGYTSTDQNPLHVYENVGTYSVTLSVTGLSGSSSITKNNYVTVTSGPTPTGTVTPTPTPPPASTIVLNTGWNFVSTPRALADGSNTAGVVFAGVNTGGRSIYYYNAETMSWQALTASSVVKPLDGIWIYSTTSTSVPLTYKNDPLDTPPTKQLFAGWNSIGFTDVNPAAARDTLQSVQSQWTMTLGFNSASQVYDNSIIKGGSGSHSDTTPMNPFKGYWLFMNAPGTLAAISA